jgi:putative hydrolase of the HAD superfamily
MADPAAAGNRALIWDFDGTLGERPERWAGAVRDALTDVVGRHQFSRAGISAVLRHGFPWHEPDLPHPHLGAADLWWDHLADVLASALLRLGVGAGAAAQAASRVRPHYTDLASWRLFDDTVPVLRELSDRGWQHVVLSNHVPELAEIMTGLGLAGHFAAVVNSAVIGYEKPHPEAFRVALEQAGRPAVAWMIGDNPVADIAGAERVGLPAILVRTRPAGGGRHLSGLAGVVELIGG